MQNQIPDNWKKVKLGEIVNFTNGRSIKISDTGKYMMYGSNGLVGKCDNSNYEDGVVVGRVGVYCGSLNYEHDKFWATDNTIVGKFKNGIDNRYLYYLLQTLALNHRAGGSAQPLLTQDVLSGIEAYLPLDVEVQLQIVSILSSLDDKIEVNNKIAKTLEEMAQNIFKEWFVKFQFPGYEKTEFIDSELGKIPKEWRLSKLKELVNIRNGFAFKSGDYKNKGVPIVRTMNFTNTGSVQLDDMIYLSVETAKKYKGFYLEKFDFLLVMVGASVGKWSIVPSNILPALQNQNMWDFMPKKEEYRFFNVYLLKKIIREQRGSTTGSARDFFRKDYFYSLDIFIPNSKILQKFNSLVESIYIKLDAILSENQKLSALRDLLLPKLMKGEVKV